MKSKKRIRFGAVCLAAMLFLFLGMKYSLPSYASESSQDCEIRFLHPVEGVMVELYEVGTANEDGDIVLAEEFASYQVNLEDSNVATILSDYIARDKNEKGIKPQKSVVTAKTEDSDTALAIFDHLNPAVYLLLCENVTADHMIFRSSPVMLQIPQWQDDIYQRSVEIHAKYDQVPEEISTDLNVTKVWKNDDPKNRPDSIVVQLMKDGEVAKEVKDAEVTLSNDNNWTYSWKELDGKAAWTVVEKTVPEGYTVSSVTEKDTVFITNTGGTPPSGPPDERIPQTGQSWWQVLSLITAGLFLILVGLILHRTKE